MSKIVWPGGSVPITSEDLLWLARSLAGETSATENGRAAAAWLMVQRMVWMRENGHLTTEGMPCSRAPTGRGFPELEPVHRPLDFTGMIRCFSSPVNPYWTDRVASKRARRRFFIMASYAALETRSPGIKDFVQRFARGEVPNNVPGATNFDAPDEAPASAHILYRIGGNVFFADHGAHVPNIRIEPDTDTSGSGTNGGGWLAGLLAVGVVLVFGYVLFKD